MLRESLELGTINRYTQFFRFIGKRVIQAALLGLYGDNQCRTFAMRRAKYMVKDDIEGLIELHEETQRNMLARLVPASHHHKFYLVLRYVEVNLLNQRDTLF